MYQGAFFRFVVLLLLIWHGVAAHAYNEGGHYYTLVALIDSAPATANLTPEELRLEAFCAELPDMARELDATSQRIAVLRSRGDWLWALNDQCQTPLSRHMVTSQYYLHGLTGTPAAPVRSAAHLIIDALNGALQSPQAQPLDRASLICARGFAIHLLGDSYAHVTLASDKVSLPANDLLSFAEMYVTGLGHLFDGHDPDYMESHQRNTWDHYVRDASSTVLHPSVQENELGQLLGKRNHCGISKQCENNDRNSLQGLIQARETDGLAPKIFVGEIEEQIDSEDTDFMGFEIATACDKAISKIYSESSNPSQSLCSRAWGKFLEQAIKAFNHESIDPTNRPKATAQPSCSAWKCKEKRDYNGEPYGSCTTEIIDNLGDGIPR